MSLNAMTNLIITIK